MRAAERARRHDVSCTYDEKDSFVAEGFDGVEFRGLHRGKPAAEDPDDNQN